MSRAYCLTCNEQVHETAGGTCPLGHPVTAPDHGPEPWVGFAGTGRPRVATDEIEDHDVPMERIDPAGRPVAHAGVNGHNGTAHNGTTNGHALGGGHGGSDPFPSTFGHRSSFHDDAPPVPTERAPADSQAAEDLAALLADALDEETPAAPGDDAPADAALWDDAPRDDAPADDDWGDLASLAAELQLDADQDTDDGPAAAAPEPAATPDAQVDDRTPDFDEAAIDSADIDALLAELTGDHDTPASDVAASTPPPAPEPPAAPQPPAPVAPEPSPEAVAPPPPPPAPPIPEPVPVSDSIPPLNDVRSAPPAVADLPDAWADDDFGDLGHDDAAEATPVDLTNFTARGRRVGGGGSSSAKKSRRTFGRKKG